MGFDELFGSSEPVQSLQEASSIKAARVIDRVFHGYQGMHGEPDEHACAGCSATGDAEWSWADVDALPMASPGDWQPEC